MQRSAHATRVVTAIFLLLLPIAALILGGWVLISVLALFCGVTLLECYNLFWPGSKKIQAKSLGILLSMLLLWALTTGSLVWTLLSILAAYWTGNLLFLGSYSKHGEGASYQDGMVFFGSLIYIPVTLHLFTRLNPMECALVLLAVIASDTAAFYAGTFFGKAKVWPQVSPKKSWVGSYGSMAGCVAVVTLLGLAFGSAPWWGYVYLGIVLNLAAQFGDFFESALKRKLGIKDSGTILPGHGGLLDRLDSLLMALPVYLAAATLFPEIILAPGFEPLLGNVVAP